MKNKILVLFISIILALSVLLSSCSVIFGKQSERYDHIPADVLETIPSFDGETPYVTINGNVPFFTEEEIVSESFEKYGERDGLGRCTVCIACIGVDIMPTETRDSITHIDPTGWLNAKYDFITDEYVYHRCHLIGYQLTGENANRENLITGTRFLNIDGMLPFENKIADYVEKTENHVMLRVTPIFHGDNLVASGVIMEAWSVEDNGAEICFNVYLYNNQPGVEIDYATGETHPAK